MATYNKNIWDGNIWEKGQTNLQEMLNHMEEGIVNAQSQGGDKPDPLWENGEGEGSLQTIGTGCAAIGIRSIATGCNTVAASNYSHAEGYDSKTVVDTGDPDLLGQGSHAEGTFSVAKGTASHAEGNFTLTLGQHSHAEGATTTAVGNDSHTEGNNTVANNLAEHAEGRYNISHKYSDIYGSGYNTQHSIGIGKPSPGLEFINNKNAVEVMQNGDVYIIGIGGYDGKNIQDAKTLQEVLAELINK